MISTVKGIVLILFLYLALVWVGSAYRNPEDFVQPALLYTVVGLAVLLALVLGSWGFGWWKTIRARKAVQPRPVRATQPLPEGSEDERVLSTLLREAAVRLSASSRFTGTETDPLMLFSGMPLYLIVGFEGAGKTSVVAASGLEADLLAGQARFEKSAPAPTALANVWLAGDAVLLEIGGRHFGGDIRSWEGLLRIIAGKPTIPFWRRLWKGERPGFELRGIVHCFDLRFFISKPGAEQVERQSQLIQERLRAAVKIFGRVFPVYTLFTKADQIPYFRDFFGRFPAKDAGQVLGCTLPLLNIGAERSQAASFENRETKRLTRAFHALYTSLTERRLSVLFHEPFFARKSKIYEFPREFARIRDSIVSLLVQTFRPNALEPTAVHRGFYFCGTREVEASAMSTASETSGFESTHVPPQSLDATVALRGDATEALKRAAVDAELNLTRVRRGGLQTQWVFVRQLFDEVIRRDQSFAGLPAVRMRKAGGQRTYALAGAIAASAILAIFFTISWYQNWRLIARAREAAVQQIDGTLQQQGLPGIDDLRAMDRMRVSAEELSRNSRKVPYTMRLGLYSGTDELTRAMRERYFKPFQRLLLNAANVGFAHFFDTLQPVSSAESSRQVGDQVKVAWMISGSGVCRLDPALITNELARAIQWNGLETAGARYDLARDQLRFYAEESEFGVPVTAPLAAGADRARAYLGQATGTDRVYQSVIDELGLSQRDPALLNAVVPNYGDSLMAPNPVSPVFTPDRWVELHARLESGKPISGNDPCLPGLRAGGGEKPDDTNLDKETKRRIGEMYDRNYMEAWQDYLSKFSVAPYRNEADAANKLKTFSDYQSPVLGVLKFVNDNTSFVSDEDRKKGGGYWDRFWTSAATLFQSKSERAKDVLDSAKARAAVLSSAFQPVRSVMPPASETWANENNKVYTDALKALSAAMQKIAQPSGQLDAELHQAADQAYNQAMDSVGQLARGFKSEAPGEVGKYVIRLLEAPIREVKRRPLIHPNPKGFSAQKVNQQLQSLCTALRPGLNKYPFNPAGANEVSLKEFADAFGPNGSIWNAHAADFAKLTVRDKNGWAPNQDSELKASSELLVFLNKAQQISDVFFAGGSPEPSLAYAIRPVFDASPDQSIELIIDGERWEFNRSRVLQHPFSWPAATPGAQGAMGTSLTANGSSVRFSNRRGLWAVFRMFEDADPRTPGQKTIEWSKTATGPFSPTVRMYFSEFPGGIDVFNPQFLSGFSCPQRAVRQ